MRLLPQSTFQTFRAQPESAILFFFVLVQIVCVAATLLFPEEFRYLSEPNIQVLLKSIAPLGILALGVGVLMVAGEFDLSVGAVFTFAAILTASLTEAGMPAFLALFAGIAVGMFAGVLNGIISIQFSIPSFIVSLGGMPVWKGATLLYHGATSQMFRPSSAFDAIFGSQLWLLHASFIWFFILAIACYFLLHHHKLGNHFFAVGGNLGAATAIGINPTRVKLIAFAFAGGFAAFAGVIAMTRVGSVQPGGGLGMELEAIAACVIGGVALTGGRGSVLGVVLGTALIFTIQDVLLLIQAPGFYFDMFVGTLIIIAAVMNNVLKAKA